MNAMILAAGRGERMAPLNADRPKPLLPFAGSALLEHGLRALSTGGWVRRVVVNTHHHADTLARWLDEAAHALGVECRLSRERRLLGTAGGVRHALEHLSGEGPIVIRNADFVDDVDLGAVVERHRTSGAAATLVLTPETPGYTPVAVDRDARIRAFGRTSRPGVDDAYVFTGLHVVDEELVAALDHGTPSDWVRDVYAPRLDAGEVAAFFHRGAWREVGTTRTYLEGHLDRALGALPVPALPDDHEVRIVGGQRVILAESASIDGARCTGPSYVGRGVTVASGASFGHAVLLERCVIERDARVSRAIVAPGTRVPARARLEGVAVRASNGASCPPGCRSTARGLFERPIGDARP